MTTCKFCNKNIGEAHHRAIYHDEHEVPTGEQWEGMQQGYKWIPTDAGIFCNGQCLYLYLKQKYS